MNHIWDTFFCFLLLPFLLLLLLIRYFKINVRIEVWRIKNILFSILSTQELSQLRGKVFHTGQKPCAPSQLVFLAGLILGLAKGQERPSSHIHSWQLSLCREMLHWGTLPLWLPHRGNLQLAEFRRAMEKGCNRN